MAHNRDKLRDLLNQGYALSKAVHDHMMGDLLDDQKVTQEWQEVYGVALAITSAQTQLSAIIARLDQEAASVDIPQSVTVNGTEYHRAPF